MSIGDPRTVPAVRAHIVPAASLTLLTALGIAVVRQVRGRFGRPAMRRGTAALSAVPDALDVSVPGPGNARLRGWFLTAAPAPEQGPAALVMHGWGGSALDMAPLAVPLCEAGVHTLLPDVRGHGRSDDCAITSMPHFAEDVAAGLSWLRAHPLVDPARIGMRFANFPPLTTLPTLTMPVLLIHGELDQVVPVAEADQLAAVAPRARLLVVPGVGHAESTASLRSATPSESCGLRNPAGARRSALEGVAPLAGIRVAAAAARLSAGR